MQPRVAAYPVEPAIHDDRLVTRDLLERCSQRSRELFVYWDEKRGERAMPARADIDPIEFRFHLPGVILVDVYRDPMRFVYRVVGTREVEARGMDPTGKEVHESWFGSSLQRVLENYFYVVDQGSYLCDFERGLSDKGRLRECEVLFLPLGDDGQTVNKILIYSHYDRR